MCNNLFFVTIFLSNNPLALQICVKDVIKTHPIVINQHPGRAIVKKALEWFLVPAKVVYGLA